MYFLFSVAHFTGIKFLYFQILPDVQNLTERLSDRNSAEGEALALAFSVEACFCTLYFLTFVSVVTGLKIPLEKHADKLFVNELLLRREQISAKQRVHWRTVRLMGQIHSWRTHT